MHRGKRGGLLRPPGDCPPPASSCTPPSRLATLCKLMTNTLNVFAYSKWKMMFKGPMLTSLFRPRAYREIQYGTWEELCCVQTDKCDRSRGCQAGCPTCRVKVQRFRRSSKGEFGDSQNPDSASI